MTRIALALLFLAAAPVSGQVGSYQIDASRSRVSISVGRSGMFRFAGHTHEVLAPSMTGGVKLDTLDMSHSAVTLTFQTAALRQSDFGIKPVSVAGVVKVKNEITITYRFVSRPL
jgi:hypothetical protein